MITGQEPDFSSEGFLEARERARAVQPAADAAQDFRDAWLFYNSETEGETDDGIVIMKETGELLPFVEYINRKGPVPEDRIN